MTFAEFCASRGYPERPRGARYVNLFEAWVRAECKAGRRPDRYDGEGINGRPVKWTRESMIAWAQEMHRKTGKPLSSSLYKVAGIGVPNSTVVAREFGSWGAFMDAAKLPRASRKPRLKHKRLFLKEGK